jgi:hypothetical protein
VKGYVQEDVLSDAKMLPNFKLKASAMPFYSRFCWLLLLDCDTTNQGQNVSSLALV